MTLQEQYEKLAQELDAEEYELHSLKAKIRVSEAAAAQLIDSAKKVGRLEEKLANLESYMKKGYQR
jgi:hypothetical protein